MNKFSLYINALQNVLNKRKGNEQDRNLIIKSVFYGVKVVNGMSEPRTYKQAMDQFYFSSAIKGIASALTPKEVMNMFPIEKDFKGHKWGTKDYFYTMNYIKTLDLNEPIGEDNILYFLWEYTNWEVTTFNLSIMNCTDTMRRYEGKKPIIQEFLIENGVKMYNKYTDEAGTEFLLDENGKTQKIRKSLPSYLKLVK